MERVLVVSFQPQSGKTTVALQLARAYQHLGRETVLMDYSTDQFAIEVLQEQQYSGIRAVAASKEAVLSKIWAQEVSDSDTVVVDTSLRMEQARHDFLLRQTNSVLLLIDISQLDLEDFELQFGEWIKRIRMVRSRLVVVATHIEPHSLLRVVQLRQSLDQFQIPLAMKLEGIASLEQIDTLAHMLLSEEMRVDSVSGNRLGRALHTATARAASMVGAVGVLSGVVDEVKREVGEEGGRPIQDHPRPFESLQHKNQLLMMENERLRSH